MRVSRMTEQEMQEQIDRYAEGLQESYNKRMKLEKRIRELEAENRALRERVRELERQRDWLADRFGGEYGGMPASKYFLLLAEQATKEAGE